MGQHAGLYDIILLRDEPCLVAMDNHLRENPLTTI